MGQVCEGRVYVGDMLILQDTAYITLFAMDKSRTG